MFVTGSLIFGQPGKYVFEGRKNIIAKFGVVYLFILVRHITQKSFIKRIFQKFLVKLSRNIKMPKSYQ